ncbi:glycosyltransferase family 39 protein [Siccirubricoccus deserti]|uniref:Glycosyltransferase RgtA/B/C/D-like domain-containing protein n=1 Tax=Siccirubricoccus deserti TaxID=2013562 RepID=A0A9X0UCR0_9PROT|nr:glycosyltransferase family 39 protein [Siccirubricoccus deserti]MBC4014683.1 hypothetical protein [Siccirubricoccus deserti]
MQFLLRTRHADAWFVWPPVLLTVLLAGRMARKLPLLPGATGDSAAYLQQAAFRPPFYGWLLESYRFITGGLEYLPLAQLVLLGAALAVFAVEFGRLLRSPLIGLATVFLVLVHTAVHDSPKYLLTEAVFLVTVLLGLAMLCRFVRRGQVAALLIAAGCFGLATLTRSTGMAFLPLPAIVAALDPRLRLWLALQRGALAGIVAVGVLLVGMGWTALRHGHFEIGSWAGVSLLGKALVLIEPEDARRLPLPVGFTEEAAADSRRLIAAQPDLAARLRAQVQVSGDVRFPVFWMAADAFWPEWRAADLREKGKLAMYLARELVMAHPWGYARMWANDWLSLVIHPAYWPAWATTVPADWSVFRFCRELDTCWGLERFDLPVFGLIPLIGVSVLGTLAAAVLIPVLGWRALRRRASPVEVLMLGMALVVHASLLATSAFEAGHVRYTVALHILDLALLLWLTRGLMRLGTRT